jgi:transcriptional regulator NrdR family protein
MKCPCGSDTNVTSTVKSDAGVFRRRKCPACGSRSQTLESWIEPKYRKPRLETALPPLPEEKDIYTISEATQIKQRKVAARRLNEDRSLRVSNYYIEDEEDY